MICSRLIIVLFVVTLKEMVFFFHSTPDDLSWHTESFVKTKQKFTFISYNNPSIQQFYHSNLFRVWRQLEPIPI